MTSSEAKSLAIDRIGLDNDIAAWLRVTRVMPDRSRELATVAVIGAGFSGTIVAAHLLRAEGPPLRLTLINRSGRLARGVAYGTRSSHHVLNVPAGRMSAFAADEDDFFRFARDRYPDVSPGSFVPRRLYGEYLEHVLLSAQARAPRGTVLEHIADEATAIEMLPDGVRGRVHFASGGAMVADRIVIALGNYAPANPPVADRRFYESRRYVRDPWAPGALAAIPNDAPVLLIGTGLTMIDVVVELSSRTRSAPLLAVSRRGLMPQPHREHGSPPSYAHLPPGIVGSKASARTYLRAVREHVDRLAVQQIDWREVIASLRPVTPRLWSALDPIERSRFLRHLRPHWDVHRHRVAPVLWAALQQALATGGLSVIAGRIVAYDEQTDGIEVEIRRRGGTVERQRVGAVINCTGPDSDIGRINDPLLDSLRSQGLARPDALGLGLDLTDEYALIDIDGRPSPVCFLVGPLLKARFWEATAVPELRVHAAALARRLRRELADARSG